MDTVKLVYAAVYDTLADWEAGHAIAHLNDGKRYTVRTVGATLEPVTTAGGMRILPDTLLSELRPEDAAMLILPGARLWDEGGNAEFAVKAAEFLAAGTPVAAICGATAGLARAGLLDDRDHTSGAAGYLAATGYRGSAHYRETDALTDRGLTTAGPTEPVAFAREILGTLDVFPPHILDAWYRLFATSDPSAYALLAEAGA